jgi:hypothetical protein
MMTDELFAPAFGFSVNQNDDLIDGSGAFALLKCPHGTLNRSLRGDGIVIGKALT